MEFFFSQIIILGVPYLSFLSPIVLVSVEGSWSKTERGKGPREKEGTRTGSEEDSWNRRKTSNETKEKRRGLTRDEYFSKRGSSKITCTPETNDTRLRIDNRREITNGVND